MIKWFWIVETFAILLLVWLIYLRWRLHQSLRKDQEDFWPFPRYELWDADTDVRLEGTGTDKAMRRLVLSLLKHHGPGEEENLFLIIYHDGWDDVLSGKELVEWANKE